MADLKNPRWMYCKALFFILIGSLSAGILILQNPTLLTLFLVSMTIWSAARAYYFAFYVIERYIDKEYRFSGLLDFCRYLVSSDRQRFRADQDVDH